MPISLGELEMLRDDAALAGLRCIFSLFCFTCVLLMSAQLCELVLRPVGGGGGIDFGAIRWLFSSLFQIKGNI